MAREKQTKFITKDILDSSIKGAFQKLDPRYMIKNPVMFVVEIGFFITLVLSIFPTVFGDGSDLRIYNIVVTVILFVTILFANFAESVAEGRGKAQAETLKNEKGYHGPSAGQKRKGYRHSGFSVKEGGCGAC